jgi:hypothetical protein
MKTLIPVLCALLLCSTCSRAQEKPTPTPASKSQTAKQAPAANATAVDKPVDAAKEKDIRRLLDLVGTKALVQQAVVDMSKNSRPVLENSLPAGEYREKLIDAFFAKFQSKFDVQQLLDMAVPIYDRHLSHEEIKGLIQFYQTPLGQKTVKALPMITTEVMEQSRKMGEGLGRQSMLEVLAEHPEFEKAMEEAQKPTQP